MSDAQPVPLLLVAGGPGVGKTTLLAHWLGDRAFASSAVLVNEPGAIAVDAHLLGGFAGVTRTLGGGCACCTARGGLAAALADLAGGRPRAALHYDRVIVELAGIAHPLPLLEDLDADAFLRERFPLHGLVTLVDAARGADGLDRAEARSSVAAADVLVLTRTEHAEEAAVERLAAALQRLNPCAEILGAGGSSAEAGDVWEAAAAAPGRALRRLEAAVEGGPVHDEREYPRASLAPVHGDDIRVHTVRFAAPVDLSGFCVRLAAFLEAHGNAVLRVKGLVAARGRRAPALIQAVGASLQPVRTLKVWPRGAKPGGLVVIARGLEEDTVRAALS